MTDTAAQKEEPVYFDLARFERLAGEGDPGALPMLHRLLDHIEQGGGPGGARSH